MTLTQKDRDLVFEKLFNLDVQYKDGEPHFWIQWKGTSLCADTHCVCGYHGHIDIDFCYYYECPRCHRKFMVGCNVKLIEMTEEEAKLMDVEFKTDDEEIEI